MSSARSNPRTAPLERLMHSSFVLSIDLTLSIKLCNSNSAWIRCRPIEYKWRLSPEVIEFRDCRCSLNCQSATLCCQLCEPAGRAAEVYRFALLLAASCMFCICFLSKAGGGDLAPSSWGDFKWGDFKAQSFPGSSAAFFFPAYCLALLLQLFPLINTVHGCGRVLRCFCSA